MTRGATLIELLVVVAILGIVLAGTVPLLRGAAATSPSWRTDLVSARQRAVATGRPVTGFADSIGRYTASPLGGVVMDSSHVMPGANRDAR